MRMSEKVAGLTISSLKTYDLRFPTISTTNLDAVHKDSIFSCAYVIIYLNSPSFEGHGFTFTLGRGTDVVQHCIEQFEFLLKDKALNDIFGNFAAFWKSLTNDSQMRWLGPEKGVVHLAVAALINALWDLWAKVEEKPLWKLLCDFTPEEIISLVDFSYLTDAITPEEALEILKENAKTKQSREVEVLQIGIPAYITSAGWMGYDDETIIKLCRESLEEGWNSFKMKVGVDLNDDIRRAQVIRNEIGYERQLMMDANQIWDVNQAIEWTKALAKFKPYWMEEPTSPDDVLGHKAISKAINPLGIQVATGEHCQNRVIFKQLITENALQICQIDSCRLAGVNEVISVLLMAAKYKIPVCPHAGGVGLCELVQHLSIFNYLYVSPSLDNTMTEFVDHMHEHFEDPVKMRKDRYVPPSKPGYSTTMKKQSIEDYSYPNGSVWVELRKQGKDKYCL